MCGGEDERIFNIQPRLRSDSYGGHGTEYSMMKGRATSAMISLSGHLPQGGDVEEINYEIL